MQTTAPSANLKKRKAEQNEWRKDYTMVEHDGRNECALI